MKTNTVKRNGFTMLEILVVLVIMSLLVTLVPPLFSKALPSLTLKAAANDFFQDLNYIRNIAILKSKKTQLVLNPMDGTYSSDDKDSGEKQVLPDYIKISASHIGLRDVTDKTPVIAFFADGSSSGGVVTFSSNERSYSVLVDWITGGVTLREGNVGD